MKHLTTTLIGLLISTAALLGQPGTVNSWVEISEGLGGFSHTLDPFDYFGAQVKGIGDLDDDGVEDIAVGAYRDDDGGYSYGAIYIIFLNSDGTVKAEQKISHTSGGLTFPLGYDDILGHSITPLGDLDGDGVEDIMSSTRGDSIWVIFLNTDGTVKSHNSIPTGSGGAKGSLIGDFDGDGVQDIVVSDSGNDDGGNNRGAFWIWLMNSDGTRKNAMKVSNTVGGFTGHLDDSDGFGSSPVSLGDLDGDGITDIAVGASGDDDGGNKRGAVWVLFMNTDGTVKSHQKISMLEGGFTGVLGEHQFGASVAAIGDVDGDGVIDIGVGAPEDDHSTLHEGSMWILFLNTDGTVKAHQKISDTEGGYTGTFNVDNNWGRACGSVGDVNDDGIPDLLVGAWLDDSGGNSSGAAWVIMLNGSESVCSAPSNPVSVVNSESSVELSWDAVGSASSYLVQGRKVGAPNFVSRTSGTNSYTVNHSFEIGALYEWQVASYCGPDTSDFTVLKNFKVDTGCAGLPANIVAWYPAEGTPDDVIDGINGTLKNGAGFASGHVGQAFSLDGDNDYVNINGVGPELAGEDDFTVEYWVKTDYLDQPDPGWVCMLGVNTNTSSNGNVFLIFMGSPLYGQNGKIMINDGGIGTGLGTDELFSNTLIGDNVWHHIAYTKDGALGTLYIDGMVDTTHSAEMIFSSTNRWNIGMEYDSSPSDYFKGQIDEFSIYTRALSIAEIQAIYNASASGKCTDCIDNGPGADSISTTAASACCEGTATVHASGGMPPYTFHWNDAIDQTSQTATGLCPGAYEVTITDANGCAETVEVTLNEAPVPTPTNLQLLSVSSTTAILAWDADPVVEKYRVFVQDVAGGPYTGGISFFNQFLFGGLTPGATYRARVRSACGTTNSDFSDTLYFNTTTAARLGQRQFRAFPNPATSQLYIEADNPLKSVELVDALGRVVYAESNPVQVLDIDVRDLPAGLYFLRAYNEEAIEILPIQIR